MSKSQLKRMKKVLAVLCATSLTAQGTMVRADEPAAKPAPAPTPTITATGKPADIPKGQSVKVGSFGRIDLHVKELDLTKVLQLLSVQSQRNIIATRNVTGTITADLYDVDFYDALDAILQSNGFRYLEKGNFIYVYTASEFDQIEKATRKTAVKVLRLNYITAADASTFVTPLLSSVGAISVSGPVAEGFQPTIADGGANKFAHAETLVIRDYPENIEEILNILKQLDIRPKQVLIEASILEAQLDEDNRFGVDLTVLANYGMSQFTNPASAVSNLVSGAVGPSGTAIQTGPGFGSKTDGTFRIGLVGSDVAAFIDALDKVSNTTILANPKVLVLNRQRADLLVGERKGYVSTTVSDTTSTQTVDFLETGTQLTVRPFVSEDNIVRLELKPSISDGTVNLLGQFVVPNESTQEVTTNVMVPSGQTVVLGGLFKEQTTVGRSQVPFLGDIPLAGIAFKGQTDSVQRDEFIFLITPTVMKDEALAAGGKRAKEHESLSRIGAREGLLPWSRSKLTAAHLNRAVAFHEAGEDDKAIWSVNRALTLDSTYNDARQLKHDLTGKELGYLGPNVLDDVIRKVVEEQARTKDSPQAAETKAAAEALETWSAPDAKAEPKAEVKAEPKTEVKPAADAPAPQPKAEVKAEPKAETKPAPAPEAPAAPAAETKPAADAGSAQDSAPAADAGEASDSTADASTAAE